jgi:hypothetical protein
MVCKSWRSIVYKLRMGAGRRFCSAGHEAALLRSDSLHRSSLLAFAKGDFGESAG